MSTTSEFDAALIADITPDSVWRHRNGIEYRVLFFTNVVHDPKPKYPLTVVYENVNTKTRWSRNAKDWHRSMTKVSSGKE
jgi:nitrate reductase beta subunit